MPPRSASRRKSLSTNNPSKSSNEVVQFRHQYGHGASGSVPVLSRGLQEDSFSCIYAKRVPPAGGTSQRLAKSADKNYVIPLIFLANRTHHRLAAKGEDLMDT